MRPGRLFSPFLAVFLLIFSCNFSTAADLQLYQGRYFSLGIPQGWQVSETTNGIEAVAPDGVTGYSFVLLMGGFGTMTPRDWLTMALQRGPYVNPRFHFIRDLPDQPGPMGLPWNVIEAELEYLYQGAQVRTHVVSSVIQGAGQYCSVLRSYQIQQQRWGQLNGLLVQVDASLRITNPVQVAGLDNVQLPKGTSHDEIYGSYNDGWNARQSSPDRISKWQREATMGVERVKDPETGQIYDMPLQNYDATMGGYRNPYRPGEILVPTVPGE